MRPPVVFRPRSGIAKDLRLPRNSFEVRIASRKLPLQASKNVESTIPTILPCANISRRVQHASVPLTVYNIMGNV